MTTNLIINESPLFEKSVHPHYGTHITSQVATTGGTGDIFSRIQTVRVDHEVAVAHVDLGRLGLVACIEKFRQSPFLYLVYGVVIEPGRVRWNDNVMGLFRYIVLLAIVLGVAFTCFARLRILCFAEIYNNIS